MATYTFITDYQGGTYITQKESSDLHTSCIMWKEAIASGGFISNLKAKEFSQSFDADFNEFPPLPLNELRNVWIFHVLLDDDQMDVHIIQTDTALVGNEVDTMSVLQRVQ